jgi:hypothetical protein
MSNDPQKLAVDFQTVSRLRAAMDDDTADLVDALCTRIGTIMEDTSLVALTIGGTKGDQRHGAIANIEAASERIVALVRAVRALQG